MAEIPKHARYATQVLFDSAVSAGSVPSGAVCFIEDTRQIWVEGVYYTMDDAEIEEKVTAALGDYYTKDEVANLIGDLDQEVKGVVSDVSGLKTEVAGKADAFDVGYGLSLEDSVLKVTLDTSLFVVVKELPTEPAVEDEGKLHLVPMGETEEGNEYAEYLWVNGAWELIGTLHADVDLSDYLPLTGGTITGELTVDGDLKAKLRRHDDAPHVVLADDDKTLYRTPVEKFAKTLKGMGPTVLKAVVAFPEDPDCGTATLRGADDVPLWDVIEKTDEITSVSLECDDGRFALVNFGIVAVGETPDYSIQCTEVNGTGHDIHTTLTLTVNYSDGRTATVNMLAVQSAATASASATSGHTGACDGVYVAYVDYDGVKRICSAAEWSDSLGAAQGVMVGDGTHEVLLAPTQASSTMYWSNNTSETVGGIITTTSSSNAKNDFNGRLNSDGIAAMGGDYLSDGYAPGFCRSYAYGAVPAGEWWLPSCGELYGLIYGHKPDVDDALAAIGATALTSGYYWSSTQYGSDYAWYVHMIYGDVGGDGKGGHYSVRAVAAFDYEL